MVNDNKKQTNDAKPSLEALADAAEEREAEKRRVREAHKARRKIWSHSRTNVINKLHEAKSRVGGKRVAMLEPDGKEITYQDMTRAVYALGNAISRMTTRGERVGLLLPTSAGGVIAFLATQLDGRIPAMLNFTAGLGALSSAIRTTEIKSIFTSRKFIEVGGYEKLVEELSELADIHYLEDIKEELKTVDKLRAAIGEKFPGLVRRPVSPDFPGAILFTSGTEGKPKGVVLSHQNLIANVEQVREQVQLEDSDIFINPLPIFHSYGLTAGCLYPIIDGKKLVPYPSPLHVKVIPEVVQRTSATIMFATDTFLQRYMRSGRDGSLNTLRYAVCGAEKVTDETRNTARRKYGFSVLEGYGVTEAAPVVAVNQPGDIRPGTVGKVLAGIETRIDPVEGLDDGGRLFIRGPNVMGGYIFPDGNGEIVPPKDGWHDTGDIVHIDGGGYLSIRGRQKRFAKIAGEMVSLAVVENCASAVYPDYLNAAVIRPDAKKGEQIILFTEHPAPKLTDLQAWARNHGVPELSVPKRLLHIEQIPLLGTGKVDYLGLDAQADDLLEAAETLPNAAE